MCRAETVQERRQAFVGVGTVNERRAQKAVAVHPEPGLRTREGPVRGRSLNRKEAAENLARRRRSGVLREHEHKPVRLTVAERLERRESELAGLEGAVLRIVIDEGKNRQVRRMLSAVGLSVLKLSRTAIGGCQLGEMPSGDHRFLSAAEKAGLLH